MGSYWEIEGSLQDSLTDPSWISVRILKAKSKSIPWRFKEALLDVHSAAKLVSWGLLVEVPSSISGRPVRDLFSAYLEIWKLLWSKKTDK